MDKDCPRVRQLGVILDVLWGRSSLRPVLEEERARARARTEASSMASATSVGARRIEPMIADRSWPWRTKVQRWFGSPACDR
eukprot:5507068-Heterocapsa_arctica.AAC.1